MPKKQGFSGEESHSLTRRRLLAGAGVAGVGIGLGGAGYLVGRESAEGSTHLDETVSFYGTRQAGIETPAQDRLHFAAFDLTIDTADELRDLLREWSQAACVMTEGKMVGDENNTLLAPPDDTGETVGLRPASLTITFGLGPDLFEKDGRDRFGLASKRPHALRQIDPLPSDVLDLTRSGGDLCVQACSDDPQVAFHAVRNLARLGRGAIVVRWSQLGFGRTSSTTRSQATPRNLMGFKDGTKNLHAEDTDAMQEFVWLGRGDDVPWMTDGTYMVTRRIRMLIEIWDRSPLVDQEDTIGRQKYSGAPLGEKDEFDPLDLSARRNGKLVIPKDAHVRLASSELNGGTEILRRGYSFTDGVVEELGEVDAGLFFICFQKNPKTQFEEIQRRLGSSDALNEYIKHTSSAVFAVPPGTRQGGYVGEGLFT
ncbi:MAG TPA: iron uptake transporter deferrochelatase/peroxidase subunit [Solirubrobacterales bacterium]|nr:iron uptake transporter deferrochelatase/peroxidase subunit [Solirubrobacterales bacterium]